MMTAVSSGRARMRRSAVWNDSSTASLKRIDSQASRTYACTIGTAVSTSLAMALVSAMRSWLSLAFQYFLIIILLQLLGLLTI